MSFETDTQEHHRSLREKFFPMVRKPIVIPPLTMTPSAKARMAELLDRQLAKEHHPKPIPGRKIWAAHQPIDVDDPITELSPSEREWREQVRNVLVEANENLMRLRSHNRDKGIVQCRREIATLLRARGWSYPRIGRFIGRDHSSVIHLLEPSRGKAKYAKLQSKSKYGPPEAVDNDLIT